MKKYLLAFFFMGTTFNLISQTNLISNGDMENWDDLFTNPDEWHLSPSGKMWERSSDFQSGEYSILLETDSVGNTSISTTTEIQFIEV